MTARQLLPDSDDYDAVADVWKSVAWAYRHIRRRVRDGGRGWREYSGPTPAIDKMMEKPRARP